MRSPLLLSALSGLALVNAQSEATPNPTIPTIPTSTDGIPTIEGALVYDGPPVIGYTGIPCTHRLLNFAPPLTIFEGPGGNASIQSGLPAASYRATLPSTNFDNATGSTITGSIVGTTNANGTGVMFSVNFAGFPSIAAYGPFGQYPICPYSFIALPSCPLANGSCALVYHIHQMPVPADGNCSATMAHLDPTTRGELHACEAMAPQTCQAGDLAGKHGNITTSTWNVMYVA